MKKVTVSISFDEEKLSTLRMYLNLKDMQLEQELEKALDSLYTKTVPPVVREFLDMKAGSICRPSPKPKKPAAPAQDNTAKEVPNNGRP